MLALLADVLPLVLLVLLVLLASLVLRCCRVAGCAAVMTLSGNPGRVVSRPPARLSSGGGGGFM